MALRIVEQAALSDVGRARQSNEDSYLERAPLFVVADGMGTWNLTQDSANQLLGMGKTVVTVLRAVAGQLRLLE